MAVSLFDKVVAHQVGIERAKGGEVKNIRQLMRSIDNEVAFILGGLPENYTKRQLDIALARINKKITLFYSKNVLLSMEKIGRDTVRVESPFAIDIVDNYLNPDGEVIKRPTKKQIFETANKTKYEGKLLSTWTNNLGKDKFNRIRRNVTEGAINNEVPSKLVTRAKQSVRIANNNSDTIAKTYVNQFSNISRDEIYNANPDNVKEIVWSSILDSGTTVTCGVRSNKRYDAQTKEPIGHTNEWNGGPGFIHWACRSVGIPTDKSGLIASGPTKGQKISDGTRTAIGAEEGYERGGNLRQDGKRAKIPNPKNELEKTQVSGNTDYETWLRTQPRNFIEDSLGVTKANEFIGGVPLESFVVPSGRELTLKQLAI